MIKVLVTDGIDREGLQPINTNGSFQLVFIENSAELLREIQDADALLVRSKTKVDSALIEKGKKLKFVGRAGVGIDNIDVNCSSKNGIIVANAPGGNTISAAEHTFALLLSLARNVSQADAAVKKGLWKRERFIGSELFGKSLGLVGFGRIGKEVAKRAAAFGMKVSAYDPYVSEAHMKSCGVNCVSFERILEVSDYISLHIPLTDQTSKMINETTLSKMKPEARLINCARGELVDEEALYRALQSKKIKGAALDVFSKEPFTDSPLLGLDHCILTPHLGASTEEAQVKVANDLALSLRDFFEKGIVRNAVNLPSIEPEVLEKASPYIDLTEKLGKFVSQIAAGGIQELKVEFSGEFPATMRSLLLLSTVRGVLANAVGERGLNWVNALPIARERGIRIEEASISDVEDFTSMITVKIKTDQTARSVSGTILSKGNPRIVRIDDLSVDVIPSGQLIVFTNVDRPGVVGFIGTILGQNQINIAEFQVGRRSIGGEAVSILNVDSPVPADVVEKIRSFSGITNVWVVDLKSSLHK